MNAPATTTARTPGTTDDAEFVAELREWLNDHLVDEFAAHKGVGGIADDSHWELRVEWERLLAADRWLNVSWPESVGGRGWTVRQELLFHIEHARAEAPYWAGSQGRDLLGPTLVEHGTPEQQARFLPRITAVEEFWGQGFSEPDAGSDLAGLRTRASLDGDGWVIDGQKIWMTFGDRADWLYVLCRTDLEAPKHRGISMLLVPRHQEGIEVRPIRNIAGGTEFSEVFFTEARTEADLVVGEVGKGWSVVMDTLGNERGGATVLPFQASFERQMRLLLEAVEARDLGGDPVLRQALARAWTGLRVMAWQNERTIGAVLDGRPPGPESSLSKLHWSTWHRSFGELLTTVLGVDAMALADDDPAAWMVRTFLNSRAETIYGGTIEIQRNILGERVLGLPKGPP